MKRMAIMTLLLLLIISGVIIHSHQQHPELYKPAKRCAMAKNPCYKISMFAQPDLYINSWQRIGGYNCIDFTSLPDNVFHGYCGEYQVKRLHY